MSTIVAVKKNGYAAIAADTLTMWGSMKESADYVVNHEKIIAFQDNYLSFSGTSAFKQVISHWLNKSKRKPKFDSVENIFNSWLTFHNQLKENYFLRPEDEDDDAFETSRISALIVNPKGIFSVDRSRYVAEYKNFTSCGSGADYAIGAMRAVYDDENKSAEDIARIGIEVAAEFDDGTGLPMTCYRVKLK